MLTAAELKLIFEKPYERATWYNVLVQNFNVNTLRKEPLDITKRLADNQYNATAFELGNFNTTDGHLVGLYELEVFEGVNIFRNRKGLRDLLKQVYKNDVEAALLVFKQGVKWRFTYVSEITTKNKTTGKREQKTTDPKRYTYLLGEGERCKTAADQFAKVNKTDDLFGGGVTLKALDEAFNVDKMSKLFFNEYRKQYGYFTALLTGEDENGKKVKEASPFLASVFDGKDNIARDFVKKMMGRIVFLYFLEKKGWLGVAENKKWGEGDENFLSNLFNRCKNKEIFYSNVLVPLFFATLNTNRKDDFFKIDHTLFKTPGYNKLKIPYLNGGLFEEDDAGTQLLVFPEALFANLFTFFDQYNFTVYEDSPDEHTVAVDPEMLGHIFENLLEDNKDKGAFYTPKEIVHYMCRESLIEYLYTKLNPQSTESFKEIGTQQTNMYGNAAKKQLTLQESINIPTEKIARKDIESFVLEHEARNIIEHEEAILIALKDVKICDPAIGSGAFPMGLLMEIYYLVETLFNVSPDVTNRIWKLGNSDVLNGAKVKEQIIQNSIYGVDIEKGAVDIARLRFWLSLVVDEETPKPLPNLDYKIVVGNSLLSKFGDEVIDIDWNIKNKHASAVQNIINDQQTKLVLLTTRQREYFLAGIDKNKQKQKIKELKVDVLINQLNLSRIAYEENNQIQLSLNPTPKDRERAAIFTEKIRDFNRTINKLKIAKQDKNAELDFFDWKLNFPEVLNEKVVKNNETGFDIIIGNPPYVSIKNQSVETRQILKTEFKNSRGADIYVAFLEKGIELLKNKFPIFYIIPNKFFGAEYGKLIRSYIFENMNVNSIWDLKDIKVFENAQISTIAICLNKNTQQKSTKIKDLKGSRFIETIYDEKGKIQIESSDSEKEFLNKIYANCVPLNSLATIRTGIVGFEYWRMKDIISSNGITSDRDVPIYTNGNFSSYTDNWETQEINLYKEKYISPTIQLSSKYLSTNTINLFKENPKLIVRGVCKKVSGILDTFGCGLLVAVHSISPNQINILLVLGIINSSLANWYHLKCYYSIRIPQGSLKYPVEFFSSFPIPKSVVSQRKVEVLVTEILTLKKINQSSDINVLEKEINYQVYILYSLSFEEACIIEGNTHWMTKEAYDNYII